MTDELTPFALAVRRLWDTEDGRFVIEQLQDMYVKQKFMPDQITDGTGVAALLSFHEGRKDVALTLMKCVNYKTGDEQ